MGYYGLTSSSNLQKKCLACVIVTGTVTVTVLASEMPLLQLDLVSVVAMLVVFSRKERKKERKRDAYKKHCLQ